MRVKAKVVRAEECPIGKTIPCDQCDHYDGWGLDMITHEHHIWCFPKKIIHAAKMKLAIPI